jgi:3-oxoadipate enol-lactonase
MSHSLAASWRMFEPQAEHLAGRFRILGYDTRGHGGSNAPAGEYTLDQLADDLKGLLDALEVRKTHFLGLSMGGMIGQTFALKYPEYVKSLVLADTTSGYGPDAATLWQDRIKVAQERGMEALVVPTLERWFTAPFRQSQPETIRRIGNMIRATPVTGYIGCCHAISKINLTAKLGGIRVPTLVIVGREDMGAPVAMAETIHQGIAGSELVVLDNAAHFGNVEQAPAFNRALDTFFARDLL